MISANSELFDKEYRDEFVSARIEIGVAFQLRALREKAKLTQGELAAKLDTQQSVIARLESSEYGKFTLQTLVRYANFFDVGLVVRYVSFGELLRDANRYSAKELEIQTFEEEYKQSQESSALNAENTAAKAVYDQVMARASGDQSPIPSRQIPQSLMDRIHEPKINQSGESALAFSSYGFKPTRESARSKIPT